LVDSDPLLDPPSKIRATTVEETWVGGYRVYQRGEKPEEAIKPTSDDR
jgi:predicted amidohydrolase YtcJ